jgi:hypothetical protein
VKKKTVVFKTPQHSAREDSRSRTRGKDSTTGNDDESNPYITNLNNSTDSSAHPGSQYEEDELDSDNEYYMHYDQFNDDLPYYEKQLPSPRLYNPILKNSKPKVRALSPMRGESPAIVIRDVLPESKLKTIKKKAKRSKSRKSRSKAGCCEINRYDIERKRRADEKKAALHKAKKKLLKKTKKKKKKGSKARKAGVSQAELERKRKRRERRVGSTYTTS